MARKSIVKVVQEPDNLVTVEVLAADISRISAGIKALRNGALTERALMLLIQHAAPTGSGRSRGNYTPLATTTIRRVLDGIEGLGREYVRKKPAK